MNKYINKYVKINNQNLINYIAIISIFTSCKFAFSICEPKDVHKLCCSALSEIPSDCVKDKQEVCTLSDKTVGSSYTCSTRTPPKPQSVPVRRLGRLLDQIQMRPSTEQDCSVDEPQSQGKLEVIDLSNVNNLMKILQHVKKLLNQGMSPTEILIIFDVDGVLTNASDPKSLNKESEKLGRRPFAKEILTELKKLGVNILASSADSFKATVPKLNSLDLGALFDLDKCSQEKGSFKSKMGEDLEYVRCGLAVSVKTIGAKGSKRKAFSPLIGLDQEKLSQIKRVVYADDRIDYIEQFKRDKELALGEKEVDYFNLTQIQTPFREPVFMRPGHPGCEGLCPHSSNFKDYMNVRVSPEEQDAFQTFMKTSPSNATTIEKIIELQPQLYGLFKSTNRKNTKDTIETHSEAVMNQFETQFKHYALGNPPIPGVRTDNLRSLLKVSLALHDIGKPIEGTKLQHKNTLPIMENVLEQLGYTQDEIDFASKVFNSDIGEVGRAVNGHFKTAKETALEIAPIAAKLKISPETLFRFQKAFFVSDASYYPALRKNFISKTSKGYTYSILQGARIEPKNAEIKNIETEISLLDPKFADSVNLKLNKCLSTYTPPSDEAQASLLKVIKQYISEEFYKRNGPSDQYKHYYDETRELLYNIVPIYDHHALALLKYPEFYDICNSKLGRREIAEHLKGMLQAKAKSTLNIFKDKIGHADSQRCFAPHDDKRDVRSGDDTWDYTNSHFAGVSDFEKEKGVYLAHMLRLRFMKDDWISQKFSDSKLAPTPGRKDTDVPKLSLTMMEPRSHARPVRGSFLGLLAKPQSQGLVATAAVDIFSNTAKTKSELIESAEKINSDMLKNLGLPVSSIGNSIIPPSRIFKAMQLLKDKGTLKNSEIIYDEPVDVLGYALFDLGLEENQEALYASLSDDLSGPSSNFILALDKLFAACSRFNKPILYMGAKKPELLYSLISPIMTQFNPPLDLSKDDLASIEKSPEKILAFFPIQKTKLEMQYYGSSDRNPDLRGLRAVKDAIKSNEQLKIKIIQILMKDEKVKKFDLFNEMIKAYPSGGLALKTVVLYALDHLYKQASSADRELMNRSLDFYQGSENDRIRHLANEMLLKFKPKDFPLDLHAHVPSALEKFKKIYSEEEIRQWTLSNPKAYDPENFKFLIHGVFPEELRPSDSNLGSYKGQPTVFDDPKAFLKRGRIATSLIGKGKDTHVLETYAPSGVILKCPRNNLVEANSQQFFSNGKYISKKFQITKPDDLLKSTPPDEYNEILVEGTNPVSKTKCEISGVYIKTEADKYLQKKARDFAKKINVPIVEVPGKYRLPVTLRPSAPFPRHHL